MTKSRPVSDEVVLHELMPLVEKSLDRHVGAANEWFPHDYVSYEEGRNFVKEPWRPEDSRLPDIAQTALELRSHVGKKLNRRRGEVFAVERVQVRPARLTGSY